MARFLVIAAVLTVGAGVLGAKELYTVATNRQPLEITFDEYVRTQPSKKWLRITQCRMEPEASLEKPLRGGKTEYYAPLRSISWDPDTGPSKDPVHIMVAWQGRGMNAILPGLSTMWTTKPVIVEGLLRFGPGGKSDDRREMADLLDNPAPDFVVLDNGKKPNSMVAVLLLSVFVIGVGLMFHLFNKERKASSRRRSRAERKRGRGDGERPSRASGRTPDRPARGASTSRERKGRPSTTRRRPRRR